MYIPVTASRAQISRRGRKRQQLSNETSASGAAIVARFLYEIPVTAHKLDISTPAIAHHQNFSHMLVLLLGSLTYDSPTVLYMTK